MTDRRTLIEQLKRAGIESNDTVMIHSSLKGMGELEGGAEGMIDAMREYLVDGLLLIPTHTWKNVNRSNLIYDARSTVPCIGALPTVAAFYSGSVRSCHPTHSLAAFGKRAEAYIRGEELCRTPTPANGCWGRLYDEHAKILLVGVGHNRNTYIHSIEERADVPNRLSEDEVPFITIDRNGIKHEQPTKINYAKGIPDVSVYFVKFSELLEKNGATHTSKLGLADTIVCDTVPMTELLMDLYEKAKKKQIDLCVNDCSIEELLA